MPVLWLVLMLSHMQSIYAVAAPASLALLVVIALLRGQLAPSMPARFAAIIIFEVYLFVMVFVQGSIANLSLVQFVSQHGQILYMLVFLVFAFVIRQEDSRLEPVVYGSFLVGAALVALSAMFSAYVAPVTITDIKFSNGLILQGPFGGRNPLAGMLGAATVVAMVNFLQPVEQRVFKRYGRSLAAVGLLIAVAFALCESRGYTLGLVAAGGFALVTHAYREFKEGGLRLKTFFIWLAAPVVLAVIIQNIQDRLVDISQDANVTTRIDLWIRAAKFFWQSPLVGIGMGVFEQSNLSLHTVIPGGLAERRDGYYPVEIVQHLAGGGLHAHNVFLEVLAELGLVGFMGIALIIGSGWAASRWQRSRLGPATSMSARVIPVMVVYLAVAGLTAGYTFTSPTTALILYFALARVLRSRWTKPPVDSERSGTARIPADGAITPKRGALVAPTASPTPVGTSGRPLQPAHASLQAMSLQPRRSRLR